MASRQNTIFSFTVFLFMVGTTHFFNDFGTSSPNPRPASACSSTSSLLVIAVAIETERARQDRRHRGRRHNVIYDTHQNAIYTAVGLMVFFYLFFEIFFRALQPDDAAR